MYDSICDQILLLDPMPYVAKAYSMVLRVENQKDNDVQFGDTIDHGAHLVKLGRNTSNSNCYHKQNKEEDKFCTYCKKSNHMKENCFKLIGYPDWWKGKKNTTQKSGNPFNL